MAPPWRVKPCFPKKVPGVGAELRTMKQLGDGHEKQIYWVKHISSLFEKDSVCHVCIATGGTDPQKVWVGLDQTGKFKNAKNGVYFILSNSLISDLEP